MRRGGGGAIIYGAWCYCCWIDQGKNDSQLYPPYAYGWHAAVILHLVKLAGAAGHFITIAFDQAFPTPALFIVVAIGFIVAVLQDPDEVQNALIGLAIVGAGVPYYIWWRRAYPDQSFES